MPLSVIEAMAAGLPVAATEVGDVAAMLAAENQAFVTPLEDAALAGAIAALARDAALRAGSARRTGRRRRRSSVEVAMVAAWGALFDAAVANRA